MKKIRMLALDFGGVITFPQRKDKAEEMRQMLEAARGPGLPPLDPRTFTVAYYGHRPLYDRGVCGAEDYWEAVGRELGASIPPELARKLVEIDLDSWFSIRPAMIDFLGGVEGKIEALVLLSNIHEDGARRLLATCPWVRSFDALVFSYEHRLMKPERDIYTLALDLAGRAAATSFTPGDCLFVDDSQTNVEGALGAGMDSFRFVDEADFAARMDSEYSLQR
jgi:putative hydrolase of the HAD superfamily